MALTTPYYLIHENRLLNNLEKIKHIRDISGAKSVLALKCFSTWCVFDLMKQYMDGTTSSSLYEARLGHEKFGKEVHAYSVAFSKNDISQIKTFANKIIFNSTSQLNAYYKEVNGINLGLRVNPGISYSHFTLADPARKHSRLGVTDKKELLKALPLIKGLMFHFNCENDDFTNFSNALDTIGRNYGAILKKLDWISLGGGLYFTKDGYPLEAFCKKLKNFSTQYGLQIYLEPGESAITQSAELVTTVLDIVRNQADIAIVDASTEAHMLDLLIYQTPAKIEKSGKGKCKYTIAGRSCLAGDIFGTYNFNTRLKPGSIIKISDAAGYSMVKKNWFNGLPMPSIAVKRLNGKTDLVRYFEYKDFINNLS
ncbi:MAG: carboxynorspermidine decarboxylase [Elusimicrobia bacterium RIFOXYA2_FULL_39_19]|nr:MAG: carboxynorspermidine decarboxylase [Elusimicrobia bacterium RIFOXYA2_FULL_39_19]